MKQRSTETENKKNRSKEASERFFTVHPSHPYLALISHSRREAAPFRGFGGSYYTGTRTRDPFPSGSNHSTSIPEVFFFFFAGIEREQLETAVGACYDNGTMYCQRMQIYEGSLYLTDYRAIFFDRHYAPARILPLLETLRRNPVF